MRHLTIITHALTMLCITASSQGAITNESGSFVSEIQRLRNLSFDKDTGLYMPPDQGTRVSFKILADKLFSGNLAGASSHAETSGYEVVIYEDTDSGLTLHGLRELLDIGGETTNGWGSYFVNPSNEVHELIQIPHPRFDTYSWEIGARLFVDMRAQGLMMAGAHRNANGQGTADVAHLTNSIFHMVHESWNGMQAENTAWSIHGFNISNHPAFPAGTDAVLSNGDGGVGFEITIIDADIETNGFTAHAFNTLSITSALNVQVNGNVAGTNFSSLGGTQNVQGQHSRSLGGNFVHIELERSIRFNATNRLTSSAGLANAGRHSAVVPPIIIEMSLPTSTQAMVRAGSLVRTRTYEVHSTSNLVDGVWSTNTAWSTSSSSTNVVVPISTLRPFLRLMLK